MPVTLTRGHFAQFDVLVGGRVVLSRKGGLLAKLLGKPWPEDDEVLTAVRDALAAGDS